eukprot:622347-Rhodomonas_salina.1
MSGTDIVYAAARWAERGVRRAVQEVMRSGERGKGGREGEAGAREGKGMRERGEEGIGRGLTLALS